MEDSVRLAHQPPFRSAVKGFGALTVGGVLGLAWILAALMIYLTLRLGGEHLRYEFDFGHSIRRHRTHTVG